MSADGESPGAVRGAALARALAFARRTYSDITLTELLTLFTIAENEGVTVCGLARLCGFTEATASRTIRGMAPLDMPGALPPSRGLVQLRRGPTENRSRHAFLTRAGRDLCAQFDRIILESRPVPLITEGAIPVLQG